MKLKTIAKFVSRNCSKFSSPENIADLATFCYLNCKCNFPPEMLAKRFSQYINPDVFKDAYHDARNSQYRKEYVGGEIFNALCNLDKEIQKRQMHINKLKSKTCLGGSGYSQTLPRATATDMRKDSTLLSISGGMISFQRSRYAKLFEDYDDR